MSLWVDKYRPSKLAAVDYHNDLSIQLSRLASTGDLPHLLFYGPSGAGKKTRIMGMLREIFGDSVQKMKIDEKVFQTPSGRKVEIHVFSSNFHLELNPSDVGIYDRVVIHEIIKEAAQTQQIDRQSAGRAFKVVVLHEADRLSKDAQHALRRTMEKYSGNFRLVLCCTSTSRMIPAIRSRCLLLRIAAPTKDEIEKVLNKVNRCENAKASAKVIEAIAEQCHGNMRRALLMLEATALQQFHDFPERTDWEIYLAQIADMILAEQSPTRLLAIRAKMYDLLTHCIPTSVIIRGLVMELTPKLDDYMAATVAQQAAFYEQRSQKGSKAIFHLEALVAKIMSIYSTYRASSK